MEKPQHSQPRTEPRDYHPLFAGVLARWLARVWRRGRDPRVLSALLGRFGAHLAVLMVAVTLGVLARLTPLEISVPEQSFNGEAPYTPQRSSFVVRAANPLTTIPERDRLTVITYTVQEGDNVTSIAEKFKLSPSTIVWSNMDLLLGAPWMIRPGQTFYIPPVDGVYHTVTKDQTPAAVAETYDVDVSAIYNPWNEIEPGEALAEGTLLLVPGGTGADFDWEPPPPDPAASASGAGWGYLANPDVSGVASRGAFILPTGSYAVSGYVFGDWRNPRHGGLDYACSMNDLIFAGEAGVVDWVGYHGGYGNLVRVTHPNGYQTYYAHLNAFAVSVGQTVYQGQVVGYCGTTGISTGSHLHYEIRLNGVPQNPKHYEP